MPSVIVYALRDGKQEEVARISLANGTLVCEPPVPWVQELMQGSLPVPLGLRKEYGPRLDPQKRPADWLKVLPSRSSSYLSFAPEEAAEV